jgi:hypothetical protein
MTIKEVKVFDDSYVIYTPESGSIMYDHRLHLYQKKNGKTLYPSASTLTNLSIAYFDSNLSRNLVEIKNRSVGGAMSALEKGTFVHKQFEDFFKESKLNTDQKVVDTEFHVKKLNACVKEKFKAESVNPVKEVIEKTYLAINKKDPNIGFGGKVDLVLEATNQEIAKRIVVDFKTGKHNDFYELQVAIYCLLHNTDVGLIYYVDDSKVVWVDFNKELYDMLLSRLSQYRLKEDEYEKNAILRDLNDGYDDEKESFSVFKKFLGDYTTLKQLEASVKEQKQKIAQNYPALMLRKIDENKGIKVSVISRRQKKVATKEGISYLIENRPDLVKTTKSTQTNSVRVLKK